MMGDVMLNAPLGGIEGVGSKFIFSGKFFMFAVYHDSLKLQMAEEIVCVCFDEFVYVPTEFLLRSGAYERRR